MPLAPGVRVGPYEILAPLGAGGMGEVYRARDTRLDRTVAIKILPPALAADPAARDRFEREARAVAAISHPNILAIHDVGRDGATMFAVSELLDGETLRSRLNAAASHGLPLRKAIDYALQVAHGLAAAHEKGIVHRDLKPENIFITMEGRAKVLDFGLAKQHAEAAAGATNAPTFAAATMPGTVLGTIGYMAPEQVRGLEVDQRADVFALGVVLYEMIAGRSPFQALTAADTMSAILNKEPASLSEIDPTLPSPVDRVIRRAMEKNVAERFHSAHDFGIALDAITADRQSSPAIGSHARRTASTRLWKRGAAALALLALGAVIGALAVLRRPQMPDAAVVRLAMLPPDKIDVVDTLAVAPDGRTIAFVGVDESSVSRLWLRRIDQAEAHALPDSDGASYPFWSHDGKSVAFFAQGRLKRIDVAGGPPRVLAPVSSPRGGTWNASGVIVFAPNSGDGLYRISAEGGAVTRLTTLDARRHDVSHRWPVFLPDGDHILFVNRGSNVDERLVMYATSLAAPATMQKIISAESSGVYANGRLFYVRGTTAFAQPFDLALLRLTGDATPLLEHVYVDPSTDGVVAFSVAGDVIASRLGSDAAQFVWFDRAGKSLGPLAPRGGGDPELSPNGKTLAFDTSFQASTGGSSGLWALDLERGATTRLSPALNNVCATWTPDGSRLIFASDRGGSFDLYEKTIGQATERELLRSNLWKYPESVSPDGKRLLFTQLDPKSRSDLWVLPMNGGPPSVFVSSDADEAQGRFSPDGRWVAYTSNESGSAQVYVRAFPFTDARWQMSLNGGANPLWRADGRELFYLSPDNRIMSAAVDGRGATFQAGVPSALFQPRRIRTQGQTGVLGGDRYYAVTPNGDRFIVNQLPSDIRASAIAVVIGEESQR